jgi:hypothetical protein
VEVTPESIEHLERVVLGMGSGEHHAVRLQGRHALEMEVLVGEEVHLESLDLEPVDEVGVGHELPGVSSIDLGPHVRDGPEA